MPSVEITDRAVYQTYYNGGEIASSDYRMVGYSNAGGSVRFSTCYKFVLPSYEGTPDSISLTVHLKNENSAYYSGKTWKLGIANSLNGVYADGVYTSYGSHTVSFSGDIAPGATQAFTVNITSSDAMFYPGATIYLYVYSGAAEFNEARITTLTGVMYYTAPTRYISTYRNR